MGSCLSTDDLPESGINIRHSIASKTQKLVIPSPNEEKLAYGENPSANGEKQMNGENPSSNDEKQMAGENPVAKSGFQTTKTQGSQFGLYSPPSRLASSDFGSKEETFFDTQVWLESDCEDDFYSVNGDFTPSRGNTPNYQRSFPGTPQINKFLSFDRVPAPMPQPSPTGKRKKLADLLKESMEREQIEDDGHRTSSDINTANVIPPKSSEGTPYVLKENSLCGHETTPNESTKLGKEKRVKAAQCCMPSLVPSLGSSDRKKQPSAARRSGG